ncbi:MAG TPA: RNA 2',3'-cyclic phosphodiesterase [Candidatus Sulfotelmatobacter sp.]|nr:RNA 2',3'-cyclic phosphodiesterase [Candidatus Sulfotelmatobacter sp.]
MRLFVALDIDDAIRERISRFVAGVAGFAPDARWVSAESLHVTLKFIGEQPDAAIEPIKTALREIVEAAPEIHFGGYGFFPTAKSARVFWVGMEAGPPLAALAHAVDEKTAALDIPKEERAFSPHLTLARARDGSGTPHRQRGDKPNRAFLRLQEKLAAPPSPEFGTMTAREFFLYQSQLSPKGSRYTKLARFELH